REGQLFRCRPGSTAGRELRRRRHAILDLTICLREVAGHGPLSVIQPKAVHVTRVPTLSSDSRRPASAKLDRDTRTHEPLPRDQQPVRMRMPARPLTPRALEIPDRAHIANLFGQPLPGATAAPATHRTRE